MCDGSFTRRTMTRTGRAQGRAEPGAAADRRLKVHRGLPSVRSDAHDESIPATGGAMDNPRRYGHAPFTVLLVHGGPGAAGEMAPVAEELSRGGQGILEPLQTADSLEGQVEELRQAVRRCASPPVSLVGHSWGAWLAWILAARHPGLVRRLIMVASGPFEVQYAPRILSTRLARLNELEREEAGSLMAALKGQESADPDALERLGRLFARADSYRALPGEGAGVVVRQDIHRRVWPEACRLRESGELLRIGRGIGCPVVAIHGDVDPHPAEGVREPLARVLKDFRFILLTHCGHTPWLEAEARDEFYRILGTELAEVQAASERERHRQRRP